MSKESVVAAPLQEAAEVKCIDMNKINFDHINLVEELRAHSLTASGAWQSDLLNRAANVIIEMRKTDKVRCIVKGCTNHKHEGAFIGDLCVPCHTMITAGNYGRGNTIFHQAEHERQILKGALVKIQEVADFGLGDV